jgi:hypothetical protein
MAAKGAATRMYEAAVRGKSKTARGGRRRRAVVRVERKKSDVRREPGKVLTSYIIYI